MIEVKDLKKARGEHPAIDHISFKLNNGAVYGIFDPDGKASHTLLALLSGALIPDCGSIHINGFDTVKDPAKARQCIGYMPAELTPYPDMTPEEYLAFIAELRGLDYEDGVRAVHELLDAAELRGRKRVLCIDLTPAEKKRLCLAQALVGDPEILILDNPADALGERDENDMLDRIDLLAEQKTIFFGSRSHASLRAVCDSVLVLSDGKLQGIYSVNDPALDPIFSDSDESTNPDGEDGNVSRLANRRRKNKRKPYTPSKRSGEYELIDDSDES